MKAKEQKEDGSDPTDIRESSGCVQSDSGRKGEPVEHQGSHAHADEQRRQRIAPRQRQHQQLCLVGDLRQKDEQERRKEHRITCYHVYETVEEDMKKAAICS